MIQAKLIVFIFFIFAQSFPFMPNNRKIKLDRFDGMCRGRNVPIRTDYKLIKTENATYYFNATNNITEDIEGDPSVQIKILRCISKENLDTCENFLLPKPSSYCSTLKSYSPMYLDYKPKYSCPIRKGIYKTFNYALDISVFLVFPLENYYWKAEAEVIEEKTQRLISCLKVAMYLIKD